jgi:Ulp1 family protease
VLVVICFVQYGNSGYNVVKNWANRKSNPGMVYQCDLLFVPVNSGTGHWMLAVIYPKTHEVFWYDDKLPLETAIPLYFRTLLTRQHISSVTLKL